MSGGGLRVTRSDFVLSGPGVDEGGMGASLPFFPCDFITPVERVERLMGKTPFPPSDKPVRGEQPGADFRNGLLHGFRPSFRPLRRVSRKRPFFGQSVVGRVAEKPLVYFFLDDDLFGRCVKADPAAVFADLLDFGFRSTFDAAAAARLLVTSRFAGRLAI